jgi:uncharacterized protein
VRSAGVVPGAFAHATVTFGASRNGQVSQGEGRVFMASAGYRGMDLHNDTAINVVALLQEQVGSARHYEVRLDGFPLDDGLLARGVEGQVKLTRLADEILVHVDARGTVDLECVRCLRTYGQPFETHFEAEFRPSVDVRTGVDLMLTEDDERFAIDENHELDIGEPLRQEILVALPMRQVCGPDCPGPDLPAEESQGEGDERLSALAQLLDDETTGPTE